MKMSYAPYARYVLGTAFLLLIGCGGAGDMFHPTFPDNKQSDVANVVERLAQQTENATPPVAVGITNEPARLFLVDLQAGTKSWEINVSAPASAPVIAGDYVLLHEARGVVGYRLRDGQELFVVEDEAMSLTGGGGDGTLAVFALSTGGGVGARSTLCVIENGSVSVYRDLEMTIGAPTASRGLIFVPWSTQNLSVLEPGGAEIARVRVLDSPIARVVVQNGQVYFGQMGVYRFGEEATPETFTQPLPRTLPGAPAFMIDPYAPTPGAASAIHKIRFDWAIAAGQSARFQNDTIYATFYRLVFGLPALEDGVRFVYSHDEDIVGAQVLDAGLLIADEGGGLTMIDANGQAAWHTTLDVQPTSMSFRANGFSPSGSGSTRLSLEDQLLAAAQNTDSRIIPARRLALELLAAAPGAVVTSHLLAVCEDGRAPTPVRQQACDTLAGRSSGAEAIVTALGRHSAFLSDVEAPPLTPLAQAAMTMDAVGAMPLLVAHLRDPHTDAADLAMLLTAIGALGGDSAVAPIRQWLQLYHATAADAGPVAVALGAGASALLAIQNEEAAEFLAELSADPLAGSAGRIRIDQALLAWQDSQDSQATPDPEEEEEQTEETEETPLEPEGPPNATTLQIAMEALAPVSTNIQSCLRADPRHAQSARVALVLQGDGTVHSMSILPERLADCIEPLIRSQAFRGNSRDVREQVTLTFRR